MVKGHAVKKLSGFTIPAVFSTGAVSRRIRHSPHQLAMTAAEKGRVLNWGLPLLLSGLVYLPGTLGEHCYQQTIARSCKCGPTEQKLKD